MTKNFPKKLPAEANLLFILFQYLRSLASFITPKNIYIKYISTPPKNTNPLSNHCMSHITICQTEVDVNPGS